MATEHQAANERTEQIHVGKCSQKKINFKESCIIACHFCLRKFIINIKIQTITKNVSSEVTQTWI